MIAVGGSEAAGVRAGPQREALGGIVPDRLKEPVAGRPVDHLGLDQALADQRGQQVKHLPIRDVAAGGDHFRGIKCPATCEDSEPVEHDPLLGAKQVVGPVDQGAQGLVARQAGAVSRGQQPEPLIQPGVDLRRREQAKAGRGELKGERDTVEADADRRHRRRVGVVEDEVTPVQCGVLREQLHRLEGGQPVRSGEIRGRDRKAGHPEDVLPASAKRFPARNKQADPRARPNDSGCQLGDRAEHLLGVVEDQQQVPVADVVEQGVEHGAPRRLADPERGSRGAGHQIGFCHRCQLDEPHPVAGPIQGIGRQLQRQPGLADPARTRDRDQPRAARH